MFASGQWRVDFSIIGINRMDTTSFTKKTLGLETVEPALTPPPVQSAQTTFTSKPKIGAGKSKTKKRDIPEGLWTKCPSCAAMIFDKELDENLKVCSKCAHHFPIGSRERIHSLVETCTFEEMDANMTSVDVLKFTGYKSKLERDRKATMLKDAVITGVGKIGPHRVALGRDGFCVSRGINGFGCRRKTHAPD